MADLYNFVVTSIIGYRTKEGMIEVTWNEDVMQIDLPKAREIVGMIQEAIEAAVSDELLFRFLTRNVGLSEEQSARALIEFREMRQGTRGIANNKPS